MPAVTDKGTTRRHRVAYERASGVPPNASRSISSFGSTNLQCKLLYRRGRLGGDFVTVTRLYGHQAADSPSKAARGKCPSFGWVQKGASTPGVTHSINDIPVVFASRDATTDIVSMVYFFPHRVFADAEQSLRSFLAHLSVVDFTVQCVFVPSIDDAWMLIESRCLPLVATYMPDRRNGR
jgi:hypothetical protein